MHRPNEAGNAMDAKGLIQAAEVVGELAENFYSLPEGGDVPAQAAVALTVARLYMLRYARHLADGMQPYPALVACVQDELPLDQRQLSKMHLITPPTTP